MGQYWIIWPDNSHVTCGMRLQFAFPLQSTLPSNCSSPVKWLVVLQENMNQYVRLLVHIGQYLQLCCLTLQIALPHLRLRVQWSLVLQGRAAFARHRQTGHRGRIKEKTRDPPCSARSASRKNWVKSRTIQSAHLCIWSTRVSKYHINAFFWEKILCTNLFNLAAGGFDCVKYATAIDRPNRGRLRDSADFFTKRLRDYHASILY